MPEPTRVEFFFDSLCPWAFRTSLWIREVAKQRPLDVSWKPFSLAIVNNLDPDAEQARRGFLLGRTIVAAQRLGGSEAVDRLYRAFGEAVHHQKVDMLQPEAVADALQTAGLPRDLAEAAQRDPETKQALRASHEEGLSKGAFGVPTLVLDGSGMGVFGPVINPVPEGAPALELWDMTVWMHRQPYLFELKRDRRPRPSPS